MPERRVTRVVIACDSVGEYQTSVETAAQLATWLEAALHGVFIEDETLLDLTAIPSVRHVGPSGESFAAIDERTILHQFAAHGARMRGAIEKAARAQEVAWSFNTVRGRPDPSILDVSGEDLLVIEAETRPFAGGARLASRLLTAALESEQPILLLSSRATAPPGIVALVQSSVARAAPLIMRAARLARASDQSLTFFLTNGAGDERPILDLIRSVSQELAERCHIEGPNGNTLANIVRAGRLLVVDADPAINSREALKGLLAIAPGNILFLR